MGYMQNLNDNKSLKKSKFYDATEVTLHVADNVPILLRFSAKVVEFQLI